MKKSAIGTGVLLVASVALALVAWRMAWFSENKTDLAQLNSILEKKYPEEQRNEEVKKTIEAQTADMTEDQKGAYLRDTLLPLFIKAMVKGIGEGYDKVMALPPSERTAELDRIIDELRKSQPPNSAKQTGEQATPQQVDEFRRKMLDLITPAERSKMENGLKMLGARMKERGITPPGWMGQ